MPANDEPSRSFIILISDKGGGRDFSSLPRPDNLWSKLEEHSGRLSGAYCRVGHQRVSVFNETWRAGVILANTGNRTWLISVIRSKAELVKDKQMRSICLSIFWKNLQFYYEIDETNHILSQKKTKKPSCAINRWLASLYFFVDNIQDQCNYFSFKQIFLKVNIFF